MIQISSSAGVEPQGNHPEYTASKAATNNIAVGVIKDELDGSGVTANTVSPGGVLKEGLTEYFRGMAKQRGWGEDWDEIEKNAQGEFVPTRSGRYGRPEEVGDLVAFLASPLSGCVNGANLRIDGGSTPTVD